VTRERGSRPPGPGTSWTGWVATCSPPRPPSLPDTASTPGGAITGQGGTRLTAVAFTDDPDLPAVDTPNGRASFLRVVGITDAELEEMKGTSTAQVLARLADHDPLLTTNPER